MAKNRPSRGRQSNIYKLKVYVGIRGGYIYEKGRSRAKIIAARFSGYIARFGDDDDDDFFFHFPFRVTSMRASAEDVKSQFAFYMQKR